jgi:hypothetical protein
MKEEIDPNSKRITLSNEEDEFVEYIDENLF